MPRRQQLTAQEARDLRIMGGEVFISDNGDNYILVSSDSEEDFLGEPLPMIGHDLLNFLETPETPEERAIRIRHGDFHGIDFQNLTPIELEAFETYSINYAQDFNLAHLSQDPAAMAVVASGRVGPDTRRIYRQFAVPNCVMTPQPNLQVHPEEVDQQLLQLAFAGNPEVNVQEVLNIVAPGGPGGPGGPGSATVQQVDDNPSKKHFVIQGGNRRRKKRISNKKKRTIKNKSKRKTRKRKSIR